jgi:hypothetical protein
MPSAIAPSTDNYAIFKGIISFQEEGTSGYRLLGNAPSSELSFDFDELEHFSAMEGINELDLTVARSKSASLVMELEEFEPDNLELMVIGTTDTAGVIEILALSQKTGALRIVNTNDVGPKFQWDFPRVQFRPSGAIPMITDDWAGVELTGKVLKTGGIFGTVQEIGTT